MIYADDTQLYSRMHSGENHATPLAKLELCIRDVITWCANNALICNPGKTEVHFSSRSTKTKVIQDIEVNGTVAQPVNSARNLGVVLDRHLNFSSNVNKICKSASLSIRNIGRIRKYLNQSGTERFVHAFVTSELDSGNTLLYALPSTRIEKLQRIQNLEVRLVTRSKTFDHVSPVLQGLVVQSRLALTQG